MAGTKGHPKKSLKRSNMNTNTQKTEGHKLLDGLLDVSLTGFHEAGRIIAERLDELERENKALRDALERLLGIIEAQEFWTGLKSQAAEQARAALKRA